MKKQILAIIITGLFLTTSIASMCVIADKQKITAQNFNKPLDEKLDLFKMFIEKKIDLKNTPYIKKFINQLIESLDDGTFIPGYYEFWPCDPINIQGDGIGDLQDYEDGNAAFLYLDEGTAELNNSLNHDYVKNEIVGFFLFFNFSGEMIAKNDTIAPVSVTGQSETAIAVELSFLLQFINNDKYKRGTEITIKVKNNKLWDIVVINPHFYIFDLDDEEKNLIYDEIVEETWEIPQLGTKTWNWDQKDSNGNQVPDGNYVIIGSFMINGRDHPVYGGFEIVEKFNKNVIKSQILLTQILEKFPHLFPVLRYSMRLH